MRNTSHNSISLSRISLPISFSRLCLTLVTPSLRHPSKPPPPCLHHPILQQFTFAYHSFAKSPPVIDRHLARSIALLLLVISASFANSFTFFIHTMSHDPIGRVSGRDAPRASDFVSDDAIEHYRAFATRGFITERGRRLANFGPTPIEVDYHLIADWLHRYTIIIEGGYTRLATYHCTYSSILVHEFFANYQSSSIGAGEEHVKSTVRGHQVTITPTN